MQNSFGKNLKALRKANHMSQTELAEKIGNTQRNVSYWEHGETEPDIDTIVAIANLFDVTTDELFGRE